jgi:hypothetical protein
MKITEKQIPKEARWAARSVIGDHVSSDTIDRALAAALNAWPKASINEDFPEVHEIILPLPKECADE